MSTATEPYNEDGEPMELWLVLRADETNAVMSSVCYSHEAAVTQQAYWRKTPTRVAHFVEVHASSEVSA